jgi:hypothetical protein
MTFNKVCYWRQVNEKRIQKTKLRGIVKASLNQDKLPLILALTYFISLKILSGI